MMIRKILGFKDRNSLHQITLKNIQEKMYKIGFNKEFTEELMVFYKIYLTRMVTNDSNNGSSDDITEYQKNLKMSHLLLSYMKNTHS